jgi:hypothetical protein
LEKEAFMDFSNLTITDWIIRASIFGVLACVVIGTLQNLFGAPKKYPPSAASHPRNLDGAPQGSFPIQGPNKPEGFNMPHMLNPLIFSRPPFGNLPIERADQEFTFTRLQRWPC